MSVSLEPLMFYVGKSFIDRARKVFKLGFIVRKPLLQILRSMGFQPTEMSMDEAMKSLEEFTGRGGISTASKEAIKTLFMPLPVLMMRKMIAFLGAYDLGFGILLEIITEISKPFGVSTITYIWVAVPKSSEGYGRLMDLLRDIRDRVGELPITPKEWEDVQPITEKLLKSGFAIKGLTENLWVNM